MCHCMPSRTLYCSSTLYPWIKFIPISASFYSNTAVQCASCLLCFPFSSRYAFASFGAWTITSSTLTTWPACKTMHLIGTLVMSVQNKCTVCREIFQRQIQRQLPEGKGWAKWTWETIAFIGKISIKTQKMYLTSRWLNNRSLSCHRTTVPDQDC